MKLSPHHVNFKGHGALAKSFDPKRIVLYVLFALFGLVLSVVGVYGSSALRLYWEANRMMNASNDLINTALGCGGSTDLSESSQTLVDSTRKLRDELDKPQWTFIRDHTGYGNDINAARTLLNAMGNLVDGPFTDMTNLSERLSGFSMENKTVDLSALAEMPQIIKTARSDIKAEISALDKLDQPTIPAVARLVDTGRNGLKSVDSLLNEYDELIDLLPQLLGENGKRTYLVAIYNPAELRSGGGMVGNIAPITADNGKVTIGDFIATTDITYPDQPLDKRNEAEAEVFGLWIWKYPQTTTMNPNFRRAAETLTDLWKNSGHKNVEVDGVIALDPVFMQSLIGATGEVTLSDGTKLNGTNAVNFFLNELYVKYPKYEEQNKFTNAASQKIMTHVFSNANASTASAMLKAIRDSSATGHFKLWMKDDEQLAALIQTNVLDANVAGTLPYDISKPVSGVYFSQLTASKLDWYLDTKITVKKTCGQTFQTAQGVLDDTMQPAMATTLADVDDRTLGDEYTVVVKMKNRLTQKELETLPVFVTGKDGNGHSYLRVTLMAPFGGEITSISYDNAVYMGNGLVADHQFVVLDPSDGIAPGDTATVSYTVRVPEGATSPLDVVTTPVIGPKGIYTGTNGVVDDSCKGDVPDKVEDELIGKDTSVPDLTDPEADGIGAIEAVAEAKAAEAKRNAGGDAATAGDGTTDGDGGSADDSANTTNGGTTDSTDTANAAGKTDSSSKGSGDKSSGTSGTGTSGTGSSGSSSSSAKDPSAMLDSFSNLTDSVQCPVDIKQLAL